MADNNEKLNALLELLKDLLTDSSAKNVLEGLQHIAFKKEIHGKGIIWNPEKGHAKQFVFNSPDKLFSSENLDLANGKHLSIDGIKIIDQQELGPTITKSGLKEVGRLKGLIVDGSLSVNQYLYYDASTDRLGLGTEQPHAALSIADQGVEIIFGSHEYNKAAIGTFNSADVVLVTDNTPRVTLSAGGNIELGNRNFGPIQVSINGTLGVDVKTPDPRVKLHVNGPIKFNDSVHLSGSEPPQGGAFNQGDIVWNSNPEQKRYVGWVCIKSGNPGIWCQFGEIK